MEKLEPYIKPYITKIDDAVGQLQRQIRQALQRAGGVVDDTFRLEPIAGETIETLGKDVVQESGEAAGRRILHEESGTVEEIQAVVTEGGEAGIESGTSILSGQWKVVNESMSDFSRAYQKQITGQEGMAWVQNGVKFDGIKDGVLLDAKGKYAQFIDKNTGEFYEWFSGKDSLIAEARRQIDASEGAKIQWYFAEEESLNVVQDLFMDKGITEIELIFEAPK